MALNPWFNLKELITAPLRITRDSRDSQLREGRPLREQVGLPDAWLTRHAAELSGGYAMSPQRSAGFG